MNEFVKIPANKQSLSSRGLLFGIGVNDAEYLTKINVGGKEVKCPAYRRWVNMLNRCYSKKYQASKRTYTDCTVCDEWLVFSNFARWYEENNEIGFHLDKDLKQKGNKIYSPKLCMFVPPSINSLLTDHRSARGGYAIGVSLYKSSGKFSASLSVDGKPQYMGYFETEESAHEAYVKAKNMEIRRKCVQHPKLASHLIGHLLINQFDKITS